jgi:hypothetical protein
MARGRWRTRNQGIRHRRRQARPSATAGS